MSDLISERWRRYRYPRYAHESTHPAHLRTAAAWHGLSAPETPTARILELGCAAGDNLIAIASRNPHAKIVGIDLNADAIALGQSMADDLGLDNLALHTLDLRELPLSGEPFDYIIAHGLYSWIPDDARAALLQIIRKRLAPSGVAHISFNTLPGWRVWGVFREMLLERFGHIDSPIAQAEHSLDYMQWLHDSQTGGDAWWASVVAAEHFRMNLGEVINVGHDQLSPINEPLWTRDFAAQMAEAGLRWVGNVDLNDNFAARRPADTQELINGVVDPIERATLLDAIVGKTFSHALVCHSEQRPTLRHSPLPDVWWWALLTAPKDLKLDSAQPVSFEASEGTAEVEVRSQLFKQALNLLSSGKPYTTPQLADALRDLLGAEFVGPTDLTSIQTALFEWATMGLIHSAVQDPAPVFPTSSRPVIDPAVRYAAANGHPVVGRRHNMLTIDDVDRLLLPLLDGERDLYDLARILEARLGDGPIGGVKQDAALPPPGPETMALSASLIRARCRSWSRAWLFSEGG